MGLLLGPGAYYAETTEGAHILSHEGEFALTGRSVYRLLDRLAPALDGRYTLAELTTQLSPDHRSMVRDLVTALIERRVRVLRRRTRGTGAKGRPRRSCHTSEGRRSARTRSRVLR